MEPVAPTEGVFYSTKELVDKLTSTLSRIEAKLDHKADAAIVEQLLLRVRVLEDHQRDQVTVNEQNAEDHVKVDRLDGLRLKIIGALTVLGLGVGTSTGIAAHVAGWLG